MSSEHVKLIEESSFASIESSRRSLIYFGRGNLPIEKCEIQRTSYISLYDKENQCHHESNYQSKDDARKRLYTASAMCLLFVMAELLGGIISNSLAILTDAAHLFSDLVSFLISIVSLWISQRPPSKRMSFGWYRAEVLGALVSILLIWLVTIVLVYIAILRISSRDFEIDSKIMLITSIFGVIVNILMASCLHGMWSKKHQHVEKHRTNINVQAALLHVLGDLFQSLGVFTAALVMFFKPEWSLIDPICTFLFSAIVISTTFSILRVVINVLMEGTPHGIDYASVKKFLQQVEGVIQVHNVRIWSLNLDKTALSAHLIIDCRFDADTILSKAMQQIRDNYQIFETTIQIELNKNNAAQLEEGGPPNLESQV